MRRARSTSRPVALVLMVPAATERGPPDRIPQGHERTDLEGAAPSAPYKRPSKQGPSLIASHHAARAFHATSGCPGAYGSGRDGARPSRSDSTRTREDGPGGRRSVGAVQETLEARSVADRLTSCGARVPRGGRFPDPRLGACGSGRDGARPSRSDSTGTREDGPGGRRSVGAVQETLGTGFVDSQHATRALHAASGGPDPRLGAYSSGRDGARPSRSDSTGT